MGATVEAVVQIVSDDEEIPPAVKPPGDALDWDSQLLLEHFKEFKDGLNDCPAMQPFLAALEGDDDDCVMLDGDPAKAVVVAMEKKPGQDGSEQELQIIAEKGEVACRDFPHPRHLCARLPFETSSHANHCTMCHCYVCESRAPCPKWGNGTLPTDHCHATDNDKKWKDLRISFRCKDLPASKRKHIQNNFGAISTAPSLQQRQLLVPQPLPHSGTTVIQPSVGRVPVASNVSQNQQENLFIRAAQNAVLQPLPHSRTIVNQPSVGRVPVASNVSQNQQSHPSIGAAQNPVQGIHLPKASAQGPTVKGKRFKRSGAAPTIYTPPSNAYNLHRSLNNTTLHPSVGIPVASNVSQNQQSHPSIGAVQNPVQGIHLPKASAQGPTAKGKRFKRSGAAPTIYTPPSNAYNLHRSLNNTTLHPSVGRVPVASNVSQNQQSHPSIGAAQNPVQGIHLPKASAQGPTVKGKRFKRSGAAPTIYTPPSNAYNLHRSLNNITLHPAPSHVFQTAQVAPGSNIVASSVHARTPQRALNAPVLSHSIQAQPASHLQVAPNKAVGTGQQWAIQCAQGLSGSLLQKSWQDALANVGSQLGVSDYNTNPPHGQQSASTQSLYSSQLFAQERTSHGSVPHSNNVPATAQMRHSNGVRLPNLNSGDSVVATQKPQALCLLNSKSSLTQIEISLNSVVAKPAPKH